MTNFKRNIYIFPLLLIVLAVSCKLPSSNDTHDEGLIKKESFVTIPESTIPIDDYIEDDITIGDSPNELKIPVSSEITDQLDVDDIIAMSPSAEYNSGLLLKTTSIITENDNLIVTTEEATLEDALEDAYINFQETLTPAEISGSEAVMSGVIFSENKGRPANERIVLESGVNLPFHYDLFNVILFDDSGDDDDSGTSGPISTEGRIIANGSIDLALDIKFETEIKNFKLTYIKFETEISESVDLSVDSYIKATLTDIKKTIYTHTFKPITIWINGFPVVFTPIVSINIGIDGFIEASVSASACQYGSVMNSLKYTLGNNQWTPEKVIDFGFDYDPPSGHLKCQVKPYAGPSLDLLLYGQVGPYIGVNGFLDLNIDSDQDPWWTLDGGAETYIGINLEKLSKRLSDFGIDGIEGRYSYTFPPYIKRIAEAGDESIGTPPIADAGPDQSLNTSDTVYLDGTGSEDPDGSVSDLSYFWQFTSKPSNSSITLSDSTSDTPSFIPDKPGTYVIKLSVFDEDSNMDTDFVSISVDTAPSVPEVISIVPASNASGISPDSNILITFSEEMNTNIANGNIDILNGSTYLPFTKSWSGNTLTLNPSSNFANSSVINVVIKKQIESILGISMSSDYVLQFTVKAPDNNNPLAVISGDFTVNANNLATYSGANSYDDDPGDDIISYLWSLTNPSGVAVSLTQNNTQTVNFTPVMEGTYRLKLTVTDKFGAKDSTTENIIVEFTQSDLGVIESISSNRTSPDALQDTLFTINIFNPTNSSRTYTVNLEQKDYFTAPVLSKNITLAAGQRGNVMFNVKFFDTVTSASLGFTLKDNAGVKITESSSQNYSIDNINHLDDEIFLRDNFEIGKSETLEINYVFRDAANVQTTRDVFISFRTHYPSVFVLDVECNSDIETTKSLEEEEYDFFRLDGEDYCIEAEIIDSDGAWIYVWAALQADNESIVLSDDIDVYPGEDAFFFLKVPEGVVPRNIKPIDYMNDGDVVRGWDSSWSRDEMDTNILGNSDIYKIEFPVPSGAQIGQSYDFYLEWDAGSGSYSQLLNINVVDYYR